MSKSFLAITLCILNFSCAQAQTAKIEEPNQYSLVFGLTQPLVLKGFNFEVNYWANKWVIDYSHGFNLHVEGKTVSKELEAQKLNFKIPHSLGFGVGYRFTKAFNLRFEPKMHIYETYYDAQTQTKSNSLVNFKTFTLGLGAYYRWLPFQKKDNFLKGITIVPSVRYWQKVGSTLDDNSFTYLNTKTNSTQTFNAPNIGVNNTPFFVNLSVGYTF